MNKILLCHYENKDVNCGDEDGSNPSRLQTPHYIIEMLKVFNSDDRTQKPENEKRKKTGK